ncbi:MAG: hypothetical protein A2X12_11735 [Bacteroidetes bacterium GWE2_29_8]|nr:MAG: hypothetical protein A2X12_11735 [Bacteroidetes bacterium GWE2_29_8]OFY20471.1 MAG: hypothetical protein A2X02_02410 [Bacteroidetes bacterium GWF2_29_10]
MIIGIRREDKYIHERRVAIIPKHVEKLIKEHNLKFIIQPSKNRIYTDNEYVNSGALVSEDLSMCDMIVGVKEVSMRDIFPNKTYMFFSHTIKGQANNMTMLKQLINCKSNLIDYEKISDDNNKRLIFFGKYAGNAGCIDTLWAIGQKLKHKNINNPFLKLKQTKDYNSLDEAIIAIKDIARNINVKGLLENKTPFIIGITGYGNVAKGVKEVLNYLNIEEITPQRLLEGDLDCNKIYTVTFKENDISINKDNPDHFDLNDYYKNPQNYINNFEQYIDKLSVLFNCMYWAPEYPRLITKDFLNNLYSKGEPKLLICGDISCDINGPIASTIKASSIDKPTFVYNPITDKATDGFEGYGLLTMAVDILPTELPREASISFSKALFDFIPQMAKADFNNSFEEVDLPKPIKKALILHKGKLTPDFKYIEKFL